MIIKNQEYTVHIIGMTNEGNGVGKIDGFTVFVPLTTVGDKVRVKIVKVCSNYCYARLEEILESSSDRIPVDCTAFSQCGGCVYRHISYESELRLKQQQVQDAFERIGGISTDYLPICGSEKISGYRNKSQYPLAVDIEGKPYAGFYAMRSHRIVPCERCLLLPDQFESIKRKILDFIAENDISIYDEKTGKGLIRHIYLRHAEKTGEIMVVLVCTRKRLPHADRLIEILSSDPNIASIVINVNEKNTNVILGESCFVLYGKEQICDVLCSNKINISPLSFYQVNRNQAEKLYEIAKDFAGLTGSEILVDLYCGAGTIGLSMAKQVKQLIGVEIIPQAIENAKENAAQNGISNAEFICADAAKATQMLLWRQLSPDVVVVDPPRKGCGESVVRDIVVMKPKKVVMISCNPATAARDCAMFQEQGYCCVKVQPVDLFPRTAHVETVVLLSHKKPDGHINVKVEFGEGEGKVPLDNIAKRAEEYKPKERVTYKMIKEYIEAKYGFKVHTAYIAEVKRNLGLPMYDAPNAVEELKQPRKHPTAEKVEAIKDALKHFEVI